LNIGCGLAIIGPVKHEDIIKQVIPKKYIIQSFRYLLQIFDVFARFLSSLQAAVVVNPRIDFAGLPAEKAPDMAMSD
jgi:hypothetical protein